MALARQWNRFRVLMHEDEVWEIIHPDDMWALDKLIVARKCGYVCGPVGMDVPKPDYYIVRPCVNAMGLGLGAQKIFIEESTDDLPLGYFWCEFFEGTHYSVDYNLGIQRLCVKGTKPSNTFVKWSKWEKIQYHIPLPEILLDIVDSSRYPWINCEYIGDKLIEIHFRKNLDFVNGISSFIPVWEGEDTTPPHGYKYIEYPDVHGRIGAFVK